MAAFDVTFHSEPWLAAPSSHLREMNLTLFMIYDLLFMSAFLVTVFAACFVGLQIAERVYFKEPSKHNSLSQALTY